MEILLIILALLLIFLLSSILLGIVRGFYYITKIFGFIILFIGQAIGLLLIPILFTIFLLYLIF